MTKLKPNVRARYNLDGENYIVEFRSFASNVLDIAVAATERLEREYGIKANPNKVALHIR